MPPLIIAHRGDSAHRPENTLASFASALEAGADLIELDVQLTRDAHLVVIHDATLDRTTNGRGRIADLTLAEVRAVSAGYPERFGAAYAGERVPVLAEVLAFLKGRAKVMVEIKPDSVTHAEDAGVEALTVEALRRADMASEAVLLSFSLPALDRCRRLAPEVRRAPLFHQASPEEMAQAARRLDTPLVLPHKSLLSDVLLARARAEGLRLATWVVDDPAELGALARFDLYGVASNRPGVLLEALAELPEATWRPDRA
jgi:glycerophosphoryl diester phosphodiesterase